MDTEPQDEPVVEEEEVEAEETDTPVEMEKE